MSAPRVFRLRVTYVKQGRLVLLSHLEVTHTLERIVRRAQLPFAISQGFSPHMKLSFGSALPVGIGSTCEIFDVQLTEYIAPDRVLSSLQQASVTDLMPQSCEYVEPKAPAASVAFPYSTYEVCFSSDTPHCEPLLTQELPYPPDITVKRKRKEKVLHVDDFLVGNITYADGRATFTLESKPTGSLRPDVLMKSSLALLDDQNVSITSITRIAQFR